MFRRFLSLALAATLAGVCGGLCVSAQSGRLREQRRAEGRGLSGLAQQERASVAADTQVRAPAAGVRAAGGQFELRRLNEGRAAPVVYADAEGKFATGVWIYLAAGGLIYLIMSAREEQTAKPAPPPPTVP